MVSVRACAPVLLWSEVTPDLPSRHMAPEKPRRPVVTSRYTLLMQATVKEGGGGGGGGKGEGDTG